ncbi:MAG: GNAT family N-acetyltransferase [Clostridiales bacterium]|jgi:predicted N-acetyltransferase YhbS|nr:GNAT family N-acetyltransferase [Clostridiales bacterium]
MILINNRLTVRDAGSADAELLCGWWNDGKVMAHAGFPNGLGTTAEKIRESLAGDSDATGRRHIIELGKTPIGEMNYRTKDGKTAEIGIKICDFTEQEKGYGTVLLSMFIDALFVYYGYERIIWDTNVMNERAQHVYEKKLNARNAGIDGDYVNYEIRKCDWSKKPPYIRLRREVPPDYHAVEELTRDAFWESSDTGATVNEHLLTHKLRQSAAFIPELDYVAEIDGRLAGHIIYSKAIITDKYGINHGIITFGPLAVAPQYKGRGAGSALARFTLAEAGRLGYPGIAIFGHPDYYPRFGFRRAGDYGLETRNGDVFDAFMALELIPGALMIPGGRFYEDPVYDELSDEETLAFNKGFPHKEPLAFAGIERLIERLEPLAAEAIKSLNLRCLEDMRTITEEAASKLPGIDGRARDVIREVMKAHGRVWGNTNNKKRYD